MITLKKGDIAPSFTLAAQTDQKISLANLKGKYVCLYFYPKDSTPGCTIQSCQFRDWNERLKEINVLVYGINNGTKQSHQQFASEYNFNFELLIDIDNKVALSYGVWGEKTMYGKKYLGIQRSTFLIDTEGNILKIWKKANPQRNAEDVYNFLKINKLY